MTCQKIVSDKLKKINNLYDYFVDIDDLITRFKNEIPESIKYKIYKDNLKKNYIDVLKYYHKILTYLETNNKKRFSLLPQLSLNLSHVRFDSRFISTIYDNFQTKENKVGIKYFEANYKDYYKQCFNLDKLKAYKSANPISFTTNGYSVCVNFEIPKLINNNDNIKNDSIAEITKINLNEEQKNKKFKRGLFEANNSYASEETLKKYHKIGLDPGSKTLAHCVSETGKQIIIKKGYYNEISHITRNNKKMKNNIKKGNIQQVYDELGKISYKKTIKLEEYNKFIIIIRENWNNIYNFYKKNSIQKLEFDSYRNKKKAINKLIRKISPKYGKKFTFNKKSKPLCSQKEFKKIIKKPVMVAFGKGNGKTTISNLRNSGPLLKSL